jgi:hypothetical protein
VDVGPPSKQWPGEFVGQGPGGAVVQWACGVRSWWACGVGAWLVAAWWACGGPAGSSPTVLSVNRGMEKPSTLWGFKVPKFPLSARSLIHRGHNLHLCPSAILDILLQFILGT